MLKRVLELNSILFISIIRFVAYACYNINLTFNSYLVDLGWSPY